jgi:hypothetical protein
MSDIVLWYDYIQNGKIINNCGSETEIIDTVVEIPNHLIKTNVDFTVATTAYGTEYFYKKYSNLKSFYPIEISRYAWSEKIDNMLADQHFFKKKCISNVEVLIWYASEGWEIWRETEPIGRLINSIHSRFPKIKIRFVFGNFVKSKHIPDYVTYKCFKNYFWLDTLFRIPIPPKLDRDKLSKYDFITLNKRYRESRYMVFNDLKNSGMLANAKYTNIFDIEIFTEDKNKIVMRMNGIREEFIDVYTIPEDLEFIKTIQTDQYFQELDQHASNKRMVERVRVNNNIMILSDIDLTNCSYLELINETYFDSVGGLFITEKTFRTIALGHIFLICGQPGLLAHLKQEGFQTFDDLFDESYDNIVSFSQRWAIIKKNLQLWLAMSDTEKKSYYMRSFDKLVHNQQVLYNKSFKKEIQELFED